MKTIYITLLTALFFTGNAQFTMLSKWHAPDSSSTSTMRDYDSTTAIPKAMGADLTWDFTNMKRGTTTTTEAFSPASTGTDVAMYPTATIVGKSGSSTMYYSTAAAQWEELGEGTDKYTDSKILMKWPVNFGSTWTDTYAGTSQGLSATGTVTGNASGHGVVILPGGAKYGNCMQIHMQDMITITGTLSGTAKMDTYLYYSQLQRFPLMSVSYITTSFGSTTITDADIKVNELVAVGVNDNNFDASLAIYPNPASDNFTVRLTNQNGSKCEINIYNVTGQVVKKVNLGNNSTIEENVNIGDLSSGIYMVKTSLGDKTSTRRLIVQ